MNYVYAVLTLFGAIGYLALMFWSSDIALDSYEKRWKRIICAVPSALFLLFCSGLIIFALARLYGGLL